ncbi:MAG: FeoA family protein [Ignavibacteria bacterium]|jgi:ferrous iron transport protein A|nr:ferrous iron transport protein A [Ignavibacteria bacterium]MDH7526707.1 FeoA family protein [Ignavibacteria bacterium]
MKTTLDKVEKGQRLIIDQLPDNDYKLQLIRFGIAEGEKVTCLDKILGGTIILKKNRLEIALGSELAKKIKVTMLN